mgnify:CR=1 FL=1
MQKKTQNCKNRGLNGQQKIKCLWRWNEVTDLFYYEKVCFYLRKI